MHKSETDTLRGVACLLLVGFHVVGQGPTTGLKLPEEHWAVLLNEWLSILRMPLFSFLSGYVYALRPVDGRYAAFTRGKVRRLLVPMLVVGTAFAVLQAMAPGSHQHVTDWRLLHVVPVAHYWFLESLFVIFLVTAALEWAGMLHSPARFAGVALCAVAWNLSPPLPVYFGLEGATYLFPFFLLGVAAVRYRHGMERPSVAHVAAVTLLAILLFHGSAMPLSLPEPLAPEVLACSLCLCVLLFHARPSVGWLAWIGSYSFGIFLFHAIFAAGARVVLGKVGVASLPLLFAVGLVAGVGGAIALTALLRRVPKGHWVIGEKAGAWKRRGESASAMATPAGTAST